MTRDEPREALACALSAGDRDALVGALRRFHAAGGSAAAAADVLALVRADAATADHEERLLDLLDITRGWCAPALRIWHDD